METGNYQWSIFLSFFHKLTDALPSYTVSLPSPQFAALNPGTSAHLALCLLEPVFSSFCLEHPKCVSGYVHTHVHTYMVPMNRPLAPLRPQCQVSGQRLVLGLREGSMSANEDIVALIRAVAGAMGNRRSCFLNPEWSGAALTVGRKGLPQGEAGPSLPEWPRLTATCGTCRRLAPCSGLVNWEPPLAESGALGRKAWSVRPVKTVMSYTCSKHMFAW